MADLLNTQMTTRALQPSAEEFGLKTAKAVTWARREEEKCCQENVISSKCRNPAAEDLREFRSRGRQERQLNKHIDHASRKLMSGP